MKLIQAIKENKDIVIMISIVFIPLIILSFFISHIILVKQKGELENQLAFYENNSYREAEVIEVQDTYIVVNDKKLGLINVDIIADIIYPTIEIGDTVLYAVDYNHTDTKLLAIKKRDS